MTPRIISDKNYSLIHERLRKAESSDIKNDQEDVLYWLDMAKQTLQFMIESAAKYNPNTQTKKQDTKVF